MIELQRVYDHHRTRGTRSPAGASGRPLSSMMKFGSNSGFSFTPSLAYPRGLQTTRAAPTM
jgi:hypothetical protein